MRLSDTEFKDWVTRIHIITLGDSQVGKTSILRCYNGDEFNMETVSTVGLDFVFKTIEINSEKVVLKLWDTAGQERFNTIGKSFYKDCQGAIVVFDLTNKETFINIQTWIQNIKENANEGFIIYLFGNKADSEIIQVNKTDIEEFINDYGIKYYETSAKTNLNIHKGITEIAEEIYKIMKGKNFIKGSRLSVNSKKSSKCC